MTLKEQFSTIDPHSFF